MTGTRDLAVVEESTSGSAQATVPGRTAASWADSFSSDFEGHADHRTYDDLDGGVEANATTSSLVPFDMDRLAADSLFKGVFEGSPDSLLIVHRTADDVFVFDACNPTAAKMLETDVVGRALDEIIRGPQADVLESELRRAIATGAMCRISDVHLSFGGICNEIHLSPLRDDRGDSDRILIVYRDTSYLRQAETDAREANRMLLMAETLAHVGHWRITFPGGGLTWSEEMFRIYGMEPQPDAPTLGQIIALSHPDDRQAVVDNLKDAIEYGHDWVHHLRLLTADGEVRHVTTRGLCEREVGGRVTAVFGVTSDVTDAKRADLARLASANLLQVTLDTMDQGVMLVDADERVLIANRRCLELFDLATRLGGAPPAAGDLWAPEVEPSGRLPEPEQSRREPHDHSSSVCEREQPNGIVLEIRTCPLSTGGSVRTYTDVTKHRLIERAVSESEARYKLLAERSSDVVTRMSLDFTREYVSPSCVQLLGYAPEELIGEKPASIIHPDDGHALYRVARALVRGECEHGAATYRARRRDGTWIWVETSLTLIRDENGAPRSLVSSLRDVTDRKNVEDRVAESEARYRLLAENASDVIMMGELAPLGQRTYVSPSCKTVLGYDVEECIRLHQADMVHAEDLSAVLSLQEQLGPERPHGTSVHRMRHKDGRWIWVEVVFTYMPATASDGPRLIKAIRDVTERHRQSQDLEAAKLAAEAGARAKSEFLANMSHELRTPLTGILGVHDLLKEAKGLNDEERRFLELAQHAGHALLAIVNDVLDFSKIDDGHMILEEIPFSLPELLEDCRVLASRSLGEKAIVIATNLDASLPARVVGDPGRLRQVLLNLLMNAIKFTESGRIEISARRCRKTEVTSIAISDTGIGMPPEALPTLFERFTQADATTTRRFGGTGLGLAICKRLVTLMGGDISATSELGRGSTFTFELTLPVNKFEQAVRSVGIEPVLQPSGCLDILLAEDNVTNQEIISTVLRRRGHRITVVCDGAAAVTAVSSRPCFDVLLLDVQMPVMDGLEAAAAIRSAERSDGRPPIPIIALTANALDEDVQRCIAAGMTMHAAKPINWVELFALLSRLDNRSSRAAPVPTLGPAILSVEVLRELAQFVGRDRLGGLLTSFAVDLRQRLASLDDPDNGDRDLSSQAHKLRSLAGQLGFLELADLCRSMQDGDGGSLDDRVMRLRDVAERALAAAEREIVLDVA